MASSRVPENWEEWLKNHNSNAAYDAKPKEVSKLCNLADEVKNYEMLAKYKNIVLLTRAPRGANFLPFSSRSADRPRQPTLRSSSRAEKRHGDRARPEVCIPTDDGDARPKPGRHDEGGIRRRDRKSK